MSEKSPRHLEALRLAALGVPVFPCEVNGKKPATPHGFKDATTDPVIINARWGEADYNIGLCPHDIGQSVVDLDGPDGIAAWKAVTEEKPRTRVVRTPHGYHVYYKGELPPTTSKIAPKIDTRGFGSYVLVPPSIVDDWIYAVSVNGEPAPLPAWITAKCVRRVDKKAAADNVELDTPRNLERASALLAGYTKSRNVAIEGQGGNGRTYRLACELLDIGLTAERALELATVPGGWNDQCEPPWDHGELADIFKHAESYAQNEAGAWVVPPAAETFKDNPALERLTAEAKAKSKDDGAAELDAATAESKHDADLKRREKYRGIKPSEGTSRPAASFWDADKTFPRYPDGGARTFAVASYSQHKTNLALAKALDAIHNHGARVLYAAGEDADELLTERIPAMCQARGITVESLDGHLVVAEVCPHLTDALEVQAFIEEHRVFNPDIVVVDTFSEALTGDKESATEVMSAAMAAARDICRAFKADMLLVHHLGKDENKGGRGSSVSAMGAAAIWIITYDRPRSVVKQFIEKMKRGKAKFSVLWGTRLEFVKRRDGKTLEVMTVVALTSEQAAQVAQAVVSSDPKDAYKSEVLAAMRLARSREPAMQHLSVRMLAQGLLPRGQQDFNEWEADIESECKRLKRSIITSKKGKPGLLSDLVRLDRFGNPISPYTFVIANLAPYDAMANAGEELEALTATEVE